MGIVSWFTSTRNPEEPGWIRRLVMPRPGRADPKTEQRKQAAEADVEVVEREGRKYFRRDAPGHSEDVL
jgi:hypothetical protein